MVHDLLSVAKNVWLLKKKTRLEEVTVTVFDAVPIEVFFLETIYCAKNPNSNYILLRLVSLGTKQYVK